jgi:shikimate dehydrogenase
MSLAGRPSNIGTRFHNYLYEQLGLDYIYKAFTTTDLEGAIRAIRALGIRGCGISMPFKEACIAYVDRLDESAGPIQSVNTIVNTDGLLEAYNTDYLAVRKLLVAHRISTADTFAVHGSGGIAKAVLATLRDLGFDHGAVVARNERTGRGLAAQYGYGWEPELPEGPAQLLINATPIGVAGAPSSAELAFPEPAVAAAAAVFDVVAMPAQTPLVALAQSLDKTVITGAELISLQALEQFVLYTGVRPTDEQARRASEFSREPATAR